MNKLHLGCGNEILAGYTNLDSAALPGVDVVHDLRQFPWPFPDNQFEHIIIKHVLEHLPDTIRVMEELWRISKKGARVQLRVPYWNSSDFITDPTHIKAFNERTFDFFDPESSHCRERPYYSKARFKIVRRIYFFRTLGRYFILPRFLHAPALFLAHFLSNIIQVMEFELEAVK